VSLTNNLLRVSLALGGVFIAASSANAQARTMPVAEVEAGCRARGRTLGYTAEYCARVAAAARSRYGNDVTATQWNSAAAVTGYKARQGR
jgi:hypothetical protein